MTTWCSSDPTFFAKCADVEKLVAVNEELSVAQNAPKEVATVLVKYCANEQDYDKDYSCRRANAHVQTSKVGVAMRLSQLNVGHGDMLIQALVSKFRSSSKLCEKRARSTRRVVQCVLG